MQAAAQGFRGLDTFTQSTAAVVFLDSWDLSMLSLWSTTGKALGECIQLVAEARGVPEAEVGYEDVALAAFGRAGQVAVSVSMYTELYGICAVLFIVMVRTPRLMCPIHAQTSRGILRQVPGGRCMICVCKGKLSIARLVQTYMSRPFEPSI